MAKTTGYTPESVAHPGDVLKDFLEDRRISAEDLAKGVSEDVAALKKILDEEAPIGKILASNLESFFDIPTNYFVDYQRDYDDYEKKEKEWARKFPKNALQDITEKDVGVWKRLHTFFDSCNWVSWERYVLQGENAFF